jgi:hypothetical protein
MQCLLQQKAEEPRSPSVSKQCVGTPKLTHIIRTIKHKQLKKQVAFVNLAGSINKQQKTNVNAMKERKVNVELSASWPVPKFHSSDATTKGNGI